MNRMNFIEERKSFLNFLSYIIILSIIKILLVNRLTLNIIPDSPHDDLWVVSAAENLINGKWLGEYNQYTLIKGCFSPLFLAFCNIIGGSFLEMVSIVYICSCIIFIFSIRPLIKKNFILCVIFAILIFNPITMSLETFQRVYRNGHSQWQILLIFSSILGIYIRRNDSIYNNVFWSILGGFSLLFFYNTREDSLIILPFVIISTLITITIILSNKKEKFNKNIFIRILLVVLPILILFFGNIIVKSINYKYYGGFLLNDRTNGYFSKVIKNLYQIEPDNKFTEKYTNREYPYYKYKYNIYHDAINKAYSVSPTLSSVKPMIELSISTWDSGEELVDGELIFDHMIFALRDGIANAGFYDNLFNSEEFYKKVNFEIEQAFNENKLQKRKVAIFTNAGPFSFEDINQIFLKLFEKINYILDLRDVSAENRRVSGSYNNIERFIDITGDKALYEEEDWIEISGWAFVDDKYGNDVRAYICDNTGKIIKEIEFRYTEDIYNYFLSKGYKSQNALKSRYNIKIENISFDDIGLIKFIDNKNNILTSFVIKDESSFDGDFRFFTDSIIDSKKNNNYECCFKFISRVNNVINIYSILQKFLFLMSIFVFLILFFKVIVKKIRYNLYSINEISILLISFGILMTFIEICFIMSYIDIIAFPTTNYLYLSPSYIVLYMFICMGVYTLYYLLENKIKGEIV